MLRRPARSIARGVAVVTLLLVGTNKALGAQETDETALRALALTAVQVPNEVLVDGDADRALRSRPHGNRVRGALAGAIDRARGKRDFLTRRGKGFSRARTEVEIDSLVIRGDSAWIKAQEVAELSYADASVTRWKIPHRLTFVRGAAGWELTNDVAQRESDFETREPRTRGADSSITQVLGPGGRKMERPERARPRGPGSAEDADDLTVLPSPASSDQRPESVRSQARARRPGGNVNLTAIADYAFRHAYSYNTAYREWKTQGGNDCANFVSQALTAGGWTHTTGVWTSPNEWWYNSFNQTSTWIKASLLLDFEKYNQPYRTQAAQYWSQTLRGDIVFFDWTGDGSIDHSGVITSYFADGEPKFSYHSNDRQDYAWSSIQYDNQNVLAYVRMVFGYY